MYNEEGMKRLLLVAVAVCAVACAGKSVDMAALSSPSDQVVWEAGTKAVGKKEWSSARQYFKRIVDAFPQSPHQADARLATADSYFEEGGTANYVLAASSYHEFLTLYPQHPRSDYAEFRAAESYFKQRNSPDRDQTQTDKALEEYEKLLDIYPESKYVEQARSRIHECRQTLARSNYMVGYFYQRGRQAWRSAIGRYEIILKDYPDYDHLDEVLFRDAECLAAAGRYAEALPQIGRLERDYPQSPFLGEAQKLRSTFPPSFAPAALPAAAAATSAPPSKGGTATTPSQSSGQPSGAVAPAKPPAADSVVPASHDAAPPSTPPPPPGGRP